MSNIDAQPITTSEVHLDADVMSQFEYPTEAVTLHEAAGSLEESKFVSAMQVLTEEFPGDINLKIEGFVINPNAQTRSVGSSATDREKNSAPSSKRGRGVQSDRKIIDLCVVDRTGAATITLWGNDAEVAELLLTEFSRTKASKAGKNPMIAVDNLRTQVLRGNKYNGTVMTAMNCLASPRTQSPSASPCIASIDKATSPYLLTAKFVMPPASAMIVRFNALDTVDAPFRVSLRGGVVEVEGIEQTMNGNSKKAFKLLDKEGTWVQCCVIGAQALMPYLCDNADVILFCCPRPW